MRLPFLRSKSDAGSADRPGPGGDDPGALQAARTQARRRLMGAVVLLVVAVAGFPLLFETQPRPMPGKGGGDGGALIIRGEGPARGAGADVAAARPDAAKPAPASGPAPAAPPAVTEAGADRMADRTADRTADRPVASPGAPAASGLPAVAVGAVAASGAAAKLALAKKPEVAASAPLKVVTASQAAAKAASAAASSPRPTVTAAAKPDKAEKDEKAVKVSTASPAASAPGAASEDAAARWVVQVGAYNDMERMRQARQKAEKLGFKTYTTEVDTPTGKRTRVRLGPFATKNEAEAAALKVKANGMAANVLSL